MISLGGSASSGPPLEATTFKTGSMTKRICAWVIPKKSPALGLAFDHAPAIPQA